jgi:hypothetical protein
MNRRIVQLAISGAVSLLASVQARASTRSYLISAAGGIAC